MKIVISINFRHWFYFGKGLSLCCIAMRWILSRVGDKPLMTPPISNQWRCVDYTLWRSKARLGFNALIPCQRKDNTLKKIQRMCVNGLSILEESTPFYNLFNESLFTIKSPCLGLLQSKCNQNSNPYL